jgi:hypothetical protein
MVLVWVCCSQAFTISLAFQTQLWDTKDQKKAEAQSLKILGLAVNASHAPMLQNFLRMYFTNVRNRLVFIPCKLAGAYLVLNSMFGSWSYPQTLG